MSPVLRRWRVVLSPELADRAFKHAVAIGDALYVFLRANRSSSNRFSFERSGLALGLVGPALFFAYLRKAGVERFESRATELAEHLVDELAATQMPTFFEGVFGVAWAWQHTWATLGSPISRNDLLLDYPLKQYLSSLPTRHTRHDVISGVAGLSIYANSRPDGSMAREQVAVIVRLLADCRTVVGNECYWLTPRDQLPPDLRSVHPAGGINLGFAHGQAGVIAALSRILMLDEIPQARQLRGEAIAYMRAWWSRDSAPVPPYAGGQTASRARLAWCYGDLTLAVALALAEATDEALLTAEDVHRVAGRSLLLSQAEAGVVDPSLCHGSAGLAHICARLFNATGHGKFRVAAERWLICCLEQHDAFVGAAGPYSKPDSQVFGASAAPDLGLLTGSAGIGLSLLALATEQLPAWDECLLCSIPPSRTLA
jgi:lantibiotic modifying enzyme